MRSLGKGANRTILDCLFRQDWGRKGGFSAAAGAAGAGSLLWITLQAGPGRFRWLQIRKGLES
ncbi:hypothetical protein CP49_24755 [Bradyrhizobium valentinum]|uniref:Uncharacterized protein n=1 Tax=Bradyrhizobium valentinum TaxID=1518501 RepID=A0A0R3LL77_9BRAD|nr:hypothetical protein CP49_24755 [Bradyrhizobium valentinum]